MVIKFHLHHTARDFYYNYAGKNIATVWLQQ